MENDRQKDFKQFLYENNFRSINTFEQGNSTFNIYTHSEKFIVFIVQYFKDGGFDVYYRTEINDISSLKEELLELINV